MQVTMDNTHKKLLDGHLLITSIGLVPTSTTTAPGFSQLPRIRFGTPAAVIKMSASRVRCSGFSVKAWTTLTVAWCRCRTIWTVLILLNLRKVSINEINYIQERNVLPATVVMLATQRCYFFQPPRLSSPWFPRQIWSTTQCIPSECREWTVVPFLSSQGSPY